MAAAALALPEREGGRDSCVMTQWIPVEEVVAVREAGSCFLTGLKRGGDWLTFELHIA